MARSTGPILALTGITIGNRTILNDEDMDWRIPIAGGFACGAFALLEKMNEQIAVALAYSALIAVLFTRVDPKVPAPVESLIAFQEGK